MGHKYKYIQRKGINTLFFYLAMLLPGLAQAQELFNPSDSDKAVMLMASLFGKIGMFGASSSDAFSSVIQVFNGACLFIGGILVAYTLVAGTLGTAHDGEMLGKKFSSVWVPVRTALGTALVLPVLPGGYCALQGIVAWLVMQSIGMASTAWQTYLGSANLSASVTMNIQSPDVKQFAYTTFQSLVCVEALKVSTKTEAAQVLGGDKTNFGFTKEEGMKDITYYFGDKNETAGFKRDTCGSLTVTKYSLANLTLQNTGLNTAMSGPVVAMIDATSAMQRSVAINTENTVQVEKMLGVLQTQAATLVATQKPIDIAGIDSAIAAYETAMKQKATSEIAALAPFKGLTESAQKDGFLFAGAYYMKLASLSDLINRSMAATPNAVGPSSTTTAGVYNDLMQTYMESLNRTLAKAKAATTFGLSDVGNVSDSSEGFFDKIRKKLDINEYMKGALRKVMNFNIQDGEHPLIAMKRLGNTVLQMGAAISTGLIAIIAVSNGPLTGVALAGQTVAQIIVSPLLLAGGFLSYVVPNMPFFLWLGAIIGWALLVIEAMIAAPLWAVMHLHPSGDDVTGKGGNGYTLVLSLLLRPILLVFGFIASLVILQVFGQLYNAIFVDVFLMNTADDTNWLMMIITFLASGLVYAGGLWVIIKKSFGVTTDLADNLLNWIGSSSGKLGQSANEVGGLSSGAYVATSQAGSMSVNATNTGLKVMGDKAEQHRRLTDADNRQANHLDRTFGVGTSEVLNKLNGKSDNEGLSSHSAIEQENRLKQGLDMFGGLGNPAGLAFMEKFKESVNENPDLTFSEHFNNAVQSGMNNSIGSQAFESAFKAANGGDAETSDTTANFLTPDFQRATKYFSSLATRMERQGSGPEEIKDTLSGIASNMKQNYENSPESEKNGGQKEFKHFFSDEMKSFRPPKIE